MSDPLIFSVSGTPRPQPRARFIKGRVVSTVDPKAKLWRLAVERAAREAVANRGSAVPIFTGAVELTCLFFFAPPASAPERVGQPHQIKPDASNLLKLVEDVMEAAGIFGNDCQISQPKPEKWWGTKPGLFVQVEPVTAERPEMSISGFSERPGWLVGQSDG